MKKNKKNFLEKIPCKNTKIQTIVNDTGQITLIIPRDRLIERIIRRFYKIPEKFTIDLDELGSKIWSLIDNNKNVYEIGQEVRKTFGEKAEPLYPRLITFLKILVNNKFIFFEKN